VPNISKIKIKVKGKVKSGGQECPPYTSHQQAALNFQRNAR